MEDLVQMMIDARDNLADKPIPAFDVDIYPYNFDDGYLANQIHIMELNKKIEDSFYG